TDRLSLRGLGPAQVEAITWPAAQGFEPAGCSADGRYVYLLALQPDDEGVTRAVVDRVSVADGERARALPAAPEIPGPWTR
ncbi:MAG: hypothetical protein MUF35_08570, partial [Candidatus Nanopelagicales bacterium]|nr:hypothetical protein [Candidatus Nanopelagicales bacterium]